MELTINGKAHEVAEEPDRPLLWVLRDELGMTGTRYGCGAGICGACTVHLDGKPARSCVTMLSGVGERVVRTIEGLGAGGELHPVQRAFVEQQVPQCGWCMSGQIMAAAALLESNPAASEAEIVEGMSANYCRCGCYVRIHAAVMQAAEEMGG